jgi:hypothetical protein
MIRCSSPQGRDDEEEWGIAYDPSRDAVQKKSGGDQESVCHSSPFLLT